jgi:hypothetical protein
MLMTQIQKWQKQSESIDSQKGGYSDMRLWPAYMITSILILTLSPLIGSFLAFGLVLTPALFIAVRAAKIENNNPESISRYEARMDAIYNKPAETTKAAKPAVRQPDPKQEHSPKQKPTTILIPNYSS